MNELEQLEYFCRELYTTNDPEIRSQAQKTCSSLCERTDCPNICQLLLQHSTSCYAQIIATTALTKYISNRDAIISHPSRLAIRDFALNYLAGHIGLEKFVQQALITLICRLTKLGWLDSIGNGPGFCDILDCASKFIECGQTSAILTGVQILNNLVSEMNHDSESDITRAIFLQRKRSSSFRDLLLLPIFRLGLNLLRDADQSFASLDLNNTEQHGLLSQCLQLVYACLSYDFIGTSGSVSSTVCDASPAGIDDLVVVQIPTSWRQIFLDPDTVPLFFRLYKNLSPDLSVFALSCLVQISSIRRSLFTNAERSIFLSQIVSGCRDILLSVNNATITSENTTTTVIGSPTNTSTNKHNTSSMNSQNCNLINNPESYHEFCLLLSRLKCNYQLNELVALSDYSSFIELLTVFTVNCLKGYTFESNQNSLYYLLALWQRLVASIPYVHPPDTHMLNNATPQIINAYIQKCLNSIPKYMNHTSINISRESIRSEKRSREFNEHSWNNVSTKSLNNSTNNTIHNNINNYSSNNNNNNSINNNTCKDNNFSCTDNECLLDDWITLSQQLNQFGTIGRCEYSKTCSIIIPLFDEYATSLEKAWNILTSNNISVNDLHLEQVLRLEEHRLAWLVYMVGALIGGRVSYANADEYDGELVCRVLQLNRLITNFITSITSSAVSNHANIMLTTQSPSMIRLELAVLSFFEQLRRVYVGENVGRLSKFYQCLLDKLGISDEIMILGVFTNKILTNLKYWSNCEAVLQRTLNLLSELSVGFSAMRKLLRLDDIQFILVNHTPEFFPFLLSTTTSAISQSSIISRLRTTFYASISRLLMVELGEDEEQFLNFVSPLTRVTNQLIITLLSGGSPNLSQELTRISIIGLARDIRGISCSLNNKSSYQMLLDWIYPNGLQLFNRALEIWSFDYTVTVPVLKTITELIHNRNGRLLFDATIPTGYLLFTYVSKLLCNFALNLLKMCLGGGLINFGVYSMFHDDSLERAMEMGIQLLLSLTDSELHDYPKLALCHFGLLEYMLNEHIIFVASLGTPILLHFLETIANNLISLDSSIIEVCCICLDYFLTHLFKIVQREQRLTRTTSNNNNNNNNNSLYLIDVNNTNLLNEDNHTTNNNNTTTTATTRNSSNNDQLLIPHLILGRGGASNHSVWSSRATSASSNLLNLLVSTTTSNSQSLEMNSSVNLLRRILIILLSSVIQENCRCQWSMCKPLLPLILLNQQYYTELKNRVITELPVERQESVTKLFDKLMEDVECNLTIKNRDR
ncbi:Exportin-7 isoform 1 [Schistosoma japonicum]|nr:Exportin-7 isoform 1 [Schistosoma japonicum]